MGILDAIKRVGLFRSGKTTAPETGSSDKEAGAIPEYARTIAFNNSFDSLLKQDKFIARSDYRHLVSQYESLSQFYAALLKSNISYVFINGKSLL